MNSKERDEINQDLEVLEGAWRIEKSEEDIALIKSVDAEKYLVADLLTDLDEIGRDYYLSQDFFTEIYEKIQNEDVQPHLMMEHAGDANRKFLERVAQYKKEILTSSEEKAYREYLSNAKQGIGGGWRDAVMPKNEFLDAHRIECKQKSMREFVNDRNYEKNTPLNLRNRKQFVVWKYEWDESSKRAIKVPYNPITGNRAKSDDKNTWSDFDTACKAIDKFRDKDFAGIGVMFAFGLIGIDIDHCINNGIITDRARDAINTINSYTEYSPSGTGVHILVFGTKPEGRCRKDEFEMYGQGRFFTLTGKPFEGKFIKIPKAEATQEGIKIIFDRYLKEEKKQAPVLSNASTHVASRLSDEKIIEKCCKSQRGIAFEKMYRGGDTSVCRNKKTREPDHSACDASVTGLLAYFTDDAVQIDRIFRQGALMRPKWDEYRGDQTYGQMTVQNALNTITSRFDPKQYYETKIKPKLQAEQKKTNSGWDNIKITAVNKKSKIFENVTERE